MRVPSYIEDTLATTSDKTIHFLNYIQEDLTQFLQAYITQLEGAIKKQNFGSLNSQIEEQIMQLNKIINIIEDSKNKTPQTPRLKESKAGLIFANTESYLSPAATTKSEFFTRHTRSRSLIVKNTSKEIIINVSETEAFVLNVRTRLDEVQKSLEKIALAQLSENQSSNVLTSAHENIIEVLISIRMRLAIEVNKLTDDFSTVLFNKSHKALTSLGFKDKQITKNFLETKNVMIRLIVTIETLFKDSTLLNELFVAWKDKKTAKTLAKNDQKNTEENAGKKYQVIARKSWITEIIKNALNKTGIEEKELIGQTDQRIISASVRNNSKDFANRNEFHEYSQNISSFIKEEKVNNAFLNVCNELLEVYASLNYLWGTLEKIENEDLSKDHNSLSLWAHEALTPNLEETKSALDKCNEFFENSLHTPPIKKFFETIKANRHLFYKDLKSVTEEIQKSRATVQKVLTVNHKAASLA